MSAKRVLLSPEPMPVTPPAKSAVVIDRFNDTVFFDHHAKGDCNFRLRLTPDQAYELGVTLVQVARP